MVGGNSMITQNLLYFNNFSTFESKLANNEVVNKHICFIESINAIWTHGKYYYCSNGNLSEELKKYATKEELAAIKALIDAIYVPTKISELENDSEYQTKAQVDARIQSIIGAAPEALDTLEEIASKLNENDNVVAAINGVLEGKADTEDVNTELAKKQDKGNYLEYEDNNGRKVITLNNHDIIGAYANTEELENKYEAAGWQPIIMLNKWNVIDVGSSRVPTNINTPKDVRPTVQESGQSGQEAHKLAYLEDLDKYALKTELGNIDLSGYATNEALAAVNAKVEAIVIPTNVSSFTNDAGYLTEHQDISNLATKTEIADFATKQEIDEVFSWYEEPAL